MKLSTACKCGEHDLCSTNGRVRLQSGKMLKCNCKCHPEPKKVVKRVEYED